MKNEQLHKGDYISLPVPAGTKSGDLVVVGGFIGVAATDRQEAINPASPYKANTSNPIGHASVWLEGCFEVPCSDAVTAPGTPLYVTAGDGIKASVTTTATGNTRAGCAGSIIRDGALYRSTKAAGTGTIVLNLGR